MNIGIIGSGNVGGALGARWAAGGGNVMENPDFGGRAAALFFCGEEKEAKQVVRQLATELEFSAEDAGPLTRARVQEPFAMMWITLAMVEGYGREIGFS